MAETQKNVPETPAHKEKLALFRNLPNRFPRTTRALALIGAGTVTVVAIGTARGLKKSASTEEHDSGSFDYSTAETPEVKEA